MTENVSVVGFFFALPVNFRINILEVGSVGGDLNRVTVKTKTGNAGSSK
jgi:hypothetical protein